MKEIGPSVAMGCCSTFLGILPLAFAGSELFRIFFKMFLSIIVLGVSHGLVLMPVVLSIFGGSMEHSPMTSKQHRDNDDTHTEETQAVEMGKVSSTD